MTMVLLIALGAIAAYGAYIAAQVTRSSAAPGDAVDGGGGIPPWAYIFAAGGVVLAPLMPHDQLRLMSLYGFQANALALGLVVAALASAVFQKRLALAAHALGTRTLGDTLGVYYESPSIRIYLLLVLFLFSIVLPASFLGGLGDLLQAVTRGAIPRGLAIAATGMLIFVISAIGGWRSVVHVCAGLSFLTALLMVFVSAYSAAVFDGLAILRDGIRTAEGILAGEIPGVIQFARGLGRDMPLGGPWTAVAIGSTAIAVAAVALSPGFMFLGLTARLRTGLAFTQVWIIGGLMCGLLLLVGPLLAAELPEAASGDLFADLSQRLAQIDEIAAVALVLMLAATLLIGTGFFAASGASIVTIELIGRFVLPGLTGSGQRLSARLALAAILALAVAGAIFAPGLAANLSTLSFSLAAQLFMALLGLCWVPWLSRPAVITGLILGLIIVFFTEPPGLIVFNGLFAELPWGRWPLTLHSAAWGLAFNIAICLVVAIFTRHGAERELRDCLHAHLRTHDRLNFGGAGARGAKWSLTLLWAFFAIGPGAILGNTFFSQPLLSGTTVPLGVPSLWVWQTVSWILGVTLVWWLSYWSRLAIIDEVAEQAPPIRIDEIRPGPNWIRLLLGRIVPAGESRRRLK